MKPSALHDRLAEAGAVHEEVSGWERPRWFFRPARDGLAARDVYSFRRPAWYDTVAREVEAVRERVGIMDISAFAKIDVSGPDAEPFVSRMIANRVPRRSGGIVLGHVLNRKGTIEAETTVVRVEDDRFFFVLAAFFETRILGLADPQSPPRTSRRASRTCPTNSVPSRSRGRARARCSPG